MTITRMARGAPGVALLLLMGATLAAAPGLAAWHLLPYEPLARQSPGERFLLWEAVMWMCGLALAFFGASAWFGSTDLYVSQRDPYVSRSPDHSRRQLEEGVRGRSLFSDIPAVPWLMIGGGIGMIVQAMVLRSAGFGS